MSSYKLQSSRPRLESPRSRSPLPPLRIRSPSYTPSPLTSPTTLLYDLPQSSSRSPPPHSSDPGLPSPPLISSPSPGASPTQSRRRTRASPSPHSRTATPAQAARQELDQFAAYCRAWYFDQDERAGQLMTQNLEALGASQRPQFSRVQASIRSAFHAAMTRRRKSEFRAHLSSTNPGGSLLAHSRANPYGKAAKKERFDKFHRFLCTWCTTGMPGTRPFFQALWALMRLQVLPEELGGAGSRRIEWELDDAVFQESAGKEFMLEAIDVLKGVLGFEEYSLAPSRRQSDERQAPPVPPPIPSASPATRPRSPSDPFLDTPAHPHAGSTVSQTSTIKSNNPAFTQSGIDDTTLLTSPRRAYKEPPDDGFELDNEEPHLRLWIAPDLDNPELKCLISVFPDFTGQALPRFRTAHGRQRGPDVEEGLEITGDSGDVQCGTGRLWIGEKERAEGWRGSWWHRLTGWWWRLFC